VRDNNFCRLGGDLPLILDYIANNQLYIDKATYITIVVGQIAVYGILLTFYQFVVSFQGSPDSVTKYLGVNLTEYFIKKKVSIFDKVVSKPFFLFLFMLEVLYKPILNIYGNYFTEEVISIMNFIWYLFVIVYFLTFIVLFWQCTQSIQMMKKISDIKRNGLVIRDINKAFMKKSMKERMTSRTIDLLNYDIEWLIESVKEDNNPRLQKKYNDLIFQIFNLYVNNREKEINKIIEKNKIVKNQVAWAYNAQCECALLNRILNAKNFAVDDELKSFVCKLHLSLVKLLTKRACLDGYEHINQGFYQQEFHDEKNNLLDCSDWKKLTISIYKNSNIQIRKKLINSLYIGYRNSEGMYKEYCRHCIFDIISANIDEIFTEKKLHNEFVQIFSKLTKEREINDYYAGIIRDKLISYSDIDAVEMVKLLNKKNSTYVFSYIIIYYSIYKFRFDWEYINITVMKALWDNHENAEENIAKIIKAFKESNIEHRFSERMYYKLMEYIHKPLTDSLLDSLYADNTINVFYVTMIKLCVLDQSYIGYANKTDIDIQIYFINELSNHNELMLHDKVKKMIFEMQFDYFIKLEHIPQKLNISLRNLLLTNIRITPEYLSEEPRYTYYNSIGEYALIKLLGMREDNAIIKESIRKAFIARNIPVDDYIDYLNKECHLCGCDLNYVQKEKMKEYLINII